MVDFSGSDDAGMVIGKNKLKQALRKDWYVHSVFICDTETILTSSCYDVSYGVATGWWVKIHVKMLSVALLHEKLVIDPHNASNRSIWLL